MTPTLERRMGRNWWLVRPAYFLVMVRELTSVFIGGFLIMFVVFLAKLSQGPEALEAYLDFLSTPLLRILNVVILASALFHTVTWFALAPKALGLRLGEEKMPPALIMGPHYAGMIAASAFILWFLIR